MNKGDLINYIRDKHTITKVEAEKIIDVFTSSVVSIIGEEKDISLQGFGKFSVSKVLAKNGRNPKTGESLIIAAYNQPKFKVGQKMKDAVNKR